MKKSVLITIVLFISPMNPVIASNETVNALLQSYISQGANSPNPKQGQLMWQKTFKGKGDVSKRSCASCHTQDLTLPGKHIKTNKPIKPMAPSINSERLTKSKKIEKWFKRNCKWTIGRECTVQEKANFLAYINQSSNN